MGYSVGDKFVLEIKGIDGLNNHMILRNIGIGTHILDKLDRLDSDYVNEHYGELQDEAYQEGLNKAWELAKKITIPAMYGGIGAKECIDIFGENKPGMELMQKYTIQEVIEKFEAYEKEQAEIKVGDVFKFFYSRCSVVKVTGSSATILWKSGKTGEVSLDFLKKQKKVGHIDIQSVLQQIGGAK